MIQYVLKKGGSYLTTLYKTSTSTSKDVADAMKFPTLEMAKQFKQFLLDVVQTSDDVIIYTIETTMNEVIE